MKVTFRIHFTPMMLFYLINVGLQVSFFYHLNTQLSSNPPKKGV